MFRALCAHRQEVKVVLYSIWYHYTCRWPSGAQDERGSVHRTATYRVWWYQMLYDTILISMCSKHVEACNKLIVKQDFVNQVG